MSHSDPTTGHFRFDGLTAGHSIAPEPGEKTRSTHTAVSSLLDHRRPQRETRGPVGRRVEYESSWNDAQVRPVWVRPVLLPSHWFSLLGDGVLLTRGLYPQDEHVRLPSQLRGGSVGRWMGGSDARTCGGCRGAKNRWVG